MRFIGLIGIFFALNIFSCRTSDNKDKTKTEDTTVIPSDTIDAEGPVTIIGRIKIGSEGSHPLATFVMIEDENGTQYSIYPRETGEELRMYDHCLMKFTVIIFDEPRGWGGLSVGRTVTEPVTPGISRFGVAPDTLSEEEHDYLAEFHKRRELSNVRIILIHNIHIPDRI